MFMKHGLIDSTIVDSNVAYTVIATRKAPKQKLNREKIINDHIAGIGKYLISKKYGIEYRTVSSVISKYKKMKCNETDNRTRDAETTAANI